MTQKFVRSLVVAVALLAGGSAGGAQVRQFDPGIPGRVRDVHATSGRVHDDDSDSDSDEDSDRRHAKKLKKEKRRGRGNAKKCWDVDRNGICDERQSNTPRCADRDRGRVDAVECRRGRIFETISRRRHEE